MRMEATAMRKRGAGLSDNAGLERDDPVNPCERWSSTSKDDVRRNDDSSNEAGNRLRSA